MAKKSGQKGFFAGHSKSSAAVISLVLHLIILVVAFTFVAVTVIKKEETVFEVKRVNRPQMQLRKLQVPVKMKKQAKPKLRQRILVKQTTKQSMPDIEMPEITGVKGGFSADGGAGLAVGFSMPEVEVFGIKGKGEKFFLILDASEGMLTDKMGGIEAYSIIKDEMLGVIDGLGPTALFNIAVYQGYQSRILFPEMVAATPGNVTKAKGWLGPLNEKQVRMTASDVGIATLGQGGEPVGDDMKIAKFDTPLYRYSEGWYQAGMLAMKQQADTVFLFTNDFGWQRKFSEDPDTYPERVKWDKSDAGNRWREAYQDAKKKLAEENRMRAARGQPPKIVSDNEWSMREEYYPDLEGPPVPEFDYYAGKDFLEAMALTKFQNRPKEGIQEKSGISSRKNRPTVNFSFNVIQFMEEGDRNWKTEKSIQRFKELAKLAKGQHRSVAGLEEVKSYVK